MNHIVNEFCIAWFLGKIGDLYKQLYIIYKTMEDVHNAMTDEGREERVY